MNCYDFSNGININNSIDYCCKRFIVLDVHPLQIHCRSIASIKHVAIQYINGIHGFEAAASHELRELQGSGVASIIF